jgi:hypothetical protein
VGFLANPARPSKTQKEFAEPLQINDPGSVESRCLQHFNSISHGLGENSHLSWPIAYLDAEVLFTRFMLTSSRLWSPFRAFTS